MIKLSASKIKLLQSCTWLFWARYHLKLPDKTNSGALRGTISHLILELLKKTRHKNIYDSIISTNSIRANKGICKLVDNYIKKFNLTNEDSKMIDEMILVGLNYDYFFDGSEEIIQAEKRFDFVGDGFMLTGFIDTLARYSDKILIRDYKTSKQKFAKSELNNNIQALLYLFIAKNWYPKLKAKVEFLFLRFPKKPSQIVEATDSQLKGIALYFKYLSDYLSDFTINKAKSDYAYDHQDKKWLCGAGKTWVCPYKNSFSYFQISDKDGKINRSVFTEKEIALKSGETAKLMTYPGCPVFNSPNKSNEL